MTESVRQWPWQKRVEYLYKYAKITRCCDITRIIEKEYGVRNMYKKVQGHIRRHLKNKPNTGVQMALDLDNQTIVPEGCVVTGCIPSAAEVAQCGGYVTTTSSGDHIFVIPEEKQKVIENLEPNVSDNQWEGEQVLAFAIIGDTHIGSKYVQLSHLHEFYDYCAKSGITDVYHVGDITDGLKMRPGHEYELYEISADEMVKDVIKNYPKREGITTHFITGNHDASLYKHVGYDIGPAITRDRDDMKYLGRDCAIVNLTPKCTLELRHPWDGSAYALSYKPQKMIEAMESDSKPNILAIGHYHKAAYMFYRNVHTFLTGCFQGQTPFTRGKGLSVHEGGWIVYVGLDADGTVKTISPNFVPFYKAIKDDYKNFKK